MVVVFWTILARSGPMPRPTPSRRTNIRAWNLPKPERQFRIGTRHFLKKNIHQDQILPFWGWSGSARSERTKVFENSGVFSFVSPVKGTTSVAGKGRESKKNHLEHIVWRTLWFLPLSHCSEGLLWHRLESMLYDTPFSFPWKVPKSETSKFLSSYSGGVRAFLLPELECGVHGALTSAKKGMFLPSKHLPSTFYEPLPLLTTLLTTPLRTPVLTESPCKAPSKNPVKDTSS